MPIPVHAWLRIALWLGPLAVLWVSLIRQLSVEWSINAQYNYGWAVPFLCLYLIWKRVRKPEGAGQMTGEQSLPTNPRSEAESGEEQAKMSEARSAEHGVERSPSSAVRCALPAVLFAVLAFLLLPARLVQVANPQWRTAGWFVALVYIGLTLCALRFALSPKRMAQPAFPSRSAPGARPSGRRFPFEPSALDFSDLVFPILFFLVAVPWPTIIEAPLIQSLTRANAAATIELLALFGVPAVQHGNVIEVSTGVVGIDEACSGIRSFQATFMLSLFFGEYFALGLLRRGLLVLAGFAFSFVFNVGRTGLLTWVAAKQGVPAISKWHDPAGIAILVGCFTGLWLLGLALQQESRSKNSESVTTPSAPGTSAGCSALPALPLALAIWVALVFLGVELWFRAHERNLKPQPEWTVSAPSEVANLTAIPFTDPVKSILRFSSGENLAWQDATGLRWQMIFLRWSPGRIAAHAAQAHNPEGCLTSTGRKLVARLPITTVEIHGLKLPFQYFQFDDDGHKLHVLYCLWQDQAESQVFTREEIASLRSRLRGIWTGRRNLGQRSIEIAVWGIEDTEEAKAAMRAQLEKLMVVEQPRTTKR